MKGLSKLSKLLKHAPGVFDVLGTLTELSIMNSCGWWKCDTNPGYRGMPKASTKSLTRSGAGYPTNHNDSI